MHLVRGRIGHLVVSEIDTEGLDTVRQRYALTYHQDEFQNGIGVNNLEELTKRTYVPQLFLAFRGFPIFSYDDRNGLSYLE